MSEIDKIKKTLENHEKRIVELEAILKNDTANISETKQKLPENIMKVIIKNLESTKLFELIVLILKYHGSLTKEQQINILKKWGKKEADSLRGGNYNRDLINTGLVHRVKKSGKEIIFGLSEKGKVEADNIIKRIR